jgi:hypothetical protein
MVGGDDHHGPNRHRYDTMQHPYSTFMSVAYFMLIPLGSLGDIHYDRREFATATTETNRTSDDFIINIIAVINIIITTSSICTGYTHYRYT